MIGDHVHHNQLLEVGENRYQVTFGSIKGIDDYSLQLNAKASRSQGFVLVNENGFDIRRVIL